MTAVFKAQLRRISSMEVWLALLVFVCHLVFILIVQDFGWDDGAITLSFSRTLSDSGKIALTPDSEIVEGYSSTLWMVLMAALHKISRPGFSEFIRISQVSAAFTCSIAAVLFFRLSRKLWSGNATPAIFALSVLLFIQKPFLTESVNGMEMLVAAMLALSIMIMIPRDCGLLGTKPCQTNLIVIFIVSSIASLVRFEFFFYLLGGSILLLYSSRSLASSIFIGGCAGFAGNAIFRLFYFNDILPNTLLAKRWPPYKDFQLDSVESILSRLKDALAGGMEILQSNRAFFLLVIGLFIFLIVANFRRSVLVELVRQTLLDSPVAYALGFCISVVLFSMLTGKNWGYDSRMQLMAVPLLVLVLCFCFQHLSLHLGSAVEASIPFYLVVVLALSSIVYPPFPDAVKAGLLYNVLGRDPLVSDKLEKGFGVTPIGFKYTGQSVSRLQKELGLESLKFLVPDVGGLGLSSPNINVLDLALLTNRKLARSGYSIFDEYLVSENPDVIETHSVWSRVSGMYFSKQFLNHYSPIVVDANWLYVRNDHLTRLRDQGALRHVNCASGCQYYRYRGSRIDEDYIARRGYDREVNALPPLWKGMR